MLGFIRRLTQSRIGLIVTFAVLVLIAIAFAAADVTGTRATPGGMTAGSAAEVGDTAIDIAELKRRAQDEVEAARQQQPGATMAEFIAAGALDTTLDRMITGLALEEFGHENGMVVGKRLVDGQIASIPALQGPTGKFDQQIYDRILQQRGLTDAGVRADIARDTIAEHLILPTQGARQVPRFVAEPYAALLLEKREGRIGFVPTSALMGGPAPSAADLRSWYRRNVARYSLPERRVIRFARVTPDQVRTQATPTDAEIAQAYQANRAVYAPSEQRTIGVVTVLDRKTADALAAKVKGGETIAAAARAAGLEPRTVSGDRAALARATSPAIANAAFAALTGTVLGPDRTAVGYSIARLDKITRSPGKSLAEARGQIAAALTAQKTQEGIGRVHDALDDAIAENANFNELIGDQKLRAEVTPPLTAEGIDTAKPAKPDPALASIAAAAFAAEEGDTPTLVQTAADGSFALVALERVVPAAPLPFDEVREVVARDFVIDRARRTARQIAGAVAARVNRGVALKQALAETGLKLPPIQPLAAPRSQLAADPRGAPPPLVMLFSMAGGTAKPLEAPGRRGWFVVKLDKIMTGDLRRTPGVVDATRADLGRVVGREYAEQFAQAVKRDVGVKRDAATIARVKADLAGEGGSNPR